MKVVILAGGFGTRMAELTEMVPKPMIEIGGRPLLWHIMKIYAAHGFDDFIVCLGYKQAYVKNYFANVLIHDNDIRVDFSRASIDTLKPRNENWKVTLVDTGLETMTGGRLKRVSEYLDGETFALTYGDGVANVDLTAELAFHKKCGRKVTVTAVQPPGRFGVLTGAETGKVASFDEKPMGEQGWINGGFFMLEPAAIDAIAGDETSWEREPLATLAEQGELGSFLHHGFWKPCDTLRDRNELESLWKSNDPPWKIW